MLSPWQPCQLYSDERTWMGSRCLGQWRGGSGHDDPGGVKKVGGGVFEVEQQEQEEVGRGRFHNSWVAPWDTGHQLSC